MNIQCFLIIFMDKDYEIRAQNQIFTTLAFHLSYGTYRR